jgi:hypothetical protein
VLIALAVAPAARAQDDGPDEDMLTRVIRAATT